MSNKNFIFGFQIAAALNNNFNAAFNAASLIYKALKLFFIVPYFVKKICLKN